MTTTVPPTAATGPSPGSMRRTSLAVGVLHLVPGAGGDTGVRWGSCSEVVVALAGIGGAVVSFPVAERVIETAALGVDHLTVDGFRPSAVAAGLPVQAVR